jgi:uncharacterized protein YyaL (SSP411 family)
MYKAIFFSIWMACVSPAHWYYNMQEAEQIAQKEHKHILLNFSGSDWCGPCMRMQDEIFGNVVFTKMADTLLVLVNADFPRKKKNQLPPRQQQLNNAMADQYNSGGKFPYTVLMDAKGKVLKAWDGFPEMKPEEFSKQVESTIDVDQ